MKNYKTTKAIRFKLEADEKNISEIKQDIKSIEAKNNEFELANFVAELNNYIVNAKAYLFYQRKDGLSAIKDKMIIKNEWLRQYAKQELIEFKAQKSSNTGKRREQITIGEIRELSQKIGKAFDEVDDTYTELANSASLELNERARKAKIGLLLKRLCANNALPLLSSLIENTSDKNETDDLSIRLKKQAIKINAQLLTGIQIYLPEQSNGLQIAKASFNYYTINKKPADFKKRIENLETNLKINLDNSIPSLKYYFDKNKINYNQINNILNAIFNDILAELKNEKVLLLGEAPTLNIENYISLRQILKNIKAEQKKQFSELMQNNIPYEELKKSNLYLLNRIELAQFTAYKEKTKKLEEIATKLSDQNLSEDVKKKLRSDKEKIAKERGGIMRDNFSSWKSFANFYRTIAQKHGRILSQLKGIEKEKAESQLLKYWALIVEENNTHKLILIPKEKAGECKKWLESQLVIQSTNNPKIIWFESLTYRSLQKLCFGFIENGTNEFNQNIKDLLPTDEKGYAINGEFAFKGDEQLKIEFYKEVLNSKYARKVLDIPVKQIEEDIIDQSFDSLDDFQITLEKICYRRYVVCTPDIVEKKLKDYGAQIFEITSLDLKNPENTKEKQSRFEHLDKHHTQIWKNFWANENEQNNFNIRLNPEITITYRQPKQSRIDKYYEKESEKKNRYLHPQFTLITTISEHSNSPTKILSFMTDDEFETSLVEFNKKFTKEDIKFAFGIDNGETELSTLGVYLPTFRKTTNEEKITELKQVKNYGFEVLTINDLNYKETDYNGKERKIIQNPSYFLKKENYMRTFNKSEQDYEKMFAEQFKKKHLLTLNLTTAKVICGHIVTNGDIPALFNLWLKHAQRNIFEMNDHIKKETAKKIHLKNQLDTDREKLKFAEYISDEKKFKKLSDEEKKKYIKWILEDRKLNNFTNAEDKKFNECQKKKGDYTSGILFASCFIDEELQSVTDIFDCRHIFKKRDEFYLIKSEKEIEEEIDSFNTDRTSHNISNEELDFKITEAKKALVANAIGVIDFLYKQYKERFNGEGLIVKEGFDTKKVEGDIEKFSGNIYRILERKLYQKFQNYGLVPPIKSLMAVRDTGIDDKATTEIMRLGNIGFVSKEKTSAICPVCEKENLSHGTVCPDCGHDLTDIVHSNDGIAGFNIAKRGFENFINDTK